MKTRATEAAAILSNFDRIMEATETAYNSTGSAARENQKVLESLNGSIQKLKSEWESLVSSKSTQDTLKFFIDLATNVVKLIKALGGLKTAFIAVATVMAIKNAATILNTYKTFSGIITTISTVGLPKYVAWLKMASAAEKGEAASATAATAATMKLQLALGAIGIIITVATALMGNFTDECEKNAEALSEAQQEYDKTHNELENVKSKMEEIEQQINDINKEPLDPTKEKTLKDLKAQNEELKNQYELLTKIDDVNRLNLLSSAYRGLMGKSNSFTVNDAKLAGAYGTPEGQSAPQYLYSGGIFKTSEYGPLINQIGQVRDAYTALDKELYNLTIQKEKLDEEIRNASDKDMPALKEEYEALTEKIEEQKKKINDNRAVWGSMMTKLREYKTILKDNVKEEDENYDVYVKLLNAINFLEDAYVDASTTTKENTNEVKENTDAVDDLTRAQKELKEATDQMYEGLGGLKDKYNTLSSAVEEYQANGKLSLDTLLKLQQNYPQYLDYLQKHGFSLENVNSLLTDEANAYIAVAKEAAEAKAKAKGLTSENIALAKAALNDAKAQILLSQSFFSLPEGVQGPPAPNPYFNQDLLDYYNTLKSIEELENSLANGFGGYSPKKTSGSSPKKETDTWKQAFTDAYNELKHRRSLDLIDTKQYIEELTALNDKYFKDRVEYETEYNKYVEELYKERQNLFKEQLNDLKFAFEMLENQGANKQTLILKYKEIQDALHQQAEYYRSLNLSENNDLIQDLQSQWWDYQKKIKELEQDIADEIEKQNKEIKEQMDKELDLLDERFEALHDYAVDMIDKEIELKEEALKKQNDLLDEQIEKYKKEEDNLENQKDIEDKLLKIEEARKKLAEAKNQKVRVYRAGKGFVYESDFNAVSQAQKQLDELLKEWNLFQEKAKIANIIAELEAEKEANEKRVNAEIADLNTLKDAWDKSLDISKDVENYKGWLTKIESSEKLSFNQRLAQVKTFVTAYNNEMALIKSNYPTTDEVSAVVNKDSNKAAITSGKSYGGVTYYPDVDYQALINNTLANAPESEKASLLKNYETKRNAKIAGEGSSQAQTSLYGGTTFSTTSSGSSKSSSSSSSSGSSSSSSGSKSSSSSSSSGSTTMSKNDQTKIAIAKEAYNAAKAKGDTAGMAAAHAVAESVRASYGYSGGGDGSQHIGLASGTNNADGNIHLVGEEGPELFIPPSGSGIIPNPKTNNLMQWGTINPASLLAAISQGQGTTIEVDNITLPNVRDAESFVEELKNFKNYAIQRQSIRK